MNAHYYAPGPGKFLTAGTIIPDFSCWPYKPEVGRTLVTFQARKTPGDVVSYSSSFEVTP